MYGRLSNKEERMESRKSYLSGYDVHEYDDANCVIGTQDKGNRFYAIAFEGTAGRPSWNYSFRTEEGRSQYIEKYIAGRKESVERKERRKSDKKAKGKYTIDAEKPHFEVGRKYFYNWSYDGEDYDSVIEVISRTDCFVTFKQRGETKRVKVYFNGNEEVLSFSVYYFCASNVCKTDDELAEIKAKQEREKEKQRKVEEEHEHDILDQIQKIEDEHPVTDSQKYCVRIIWVEGYEFECKYMNGRKFSLVAAEKIFALVDTDRVDRALGYDKWKFEIIDSNGENVLTDRYDMGDNNGGLIKFLQNTNYGVDISGIIDEYNNQIVGGQIVSISLAPWVEELKKERDRVFEEMEKEASMMLDMMSVEELKNLAMALNDVEMIRYLGRYVYSINKEKGEQLWAELKKEIRGL